MLKRAIKSVINAVGLDLVRVQGRWRGQPIEPSFARELDAAEREILRRVEPYTLTSAERIIALVRAVRYLTRYQIPGAIVECGVWRGGSMMAAALALLQEGDTSRPLYLFDTFEGMPEPTARDRDGSGVPASAILAATAKNTGVWCYATPDDVRNTMGLTGYPPEKVVLCKGRVEDTIPYPGIEAIALLRLDTDWYESTYHELKHLHPLLSVGGVLILDDYGHWQGAREATERYFAENKDCPVLLHRVDYTGRIGRVVPALPRFREILLVLIAAYGWTADPLLGRPNMIC